MTIHFPSIAAINAGACSPLAIVLPVSAPQWLQPIYFAFHARNCAHPNAQAFPGAPIDPAITNQFAIEPYDESRGQPHADPLRKIRNLIIFREIQAQMRNGAFEPQLIGKLQRRLQNPPADHARPEFLRTDARKTTQRQ